MNYISLKEWASAHGIDPATARQRAGRGAFQTAKKIGRDWVIDKNEPLIDHRKLSDPDSMTLAEFRRMSTALNLTEEERKEILK